MIATRLEHGRVFEVAECDRCGVRGPEFRRPPGRLPTEILEHQVWAVIHALTADWRFVVAGRGSSHEALQLACLDCRGRLSFVARCIMCGCTEERACTDGGRHGGCSWVQAPAEGNPVCSSCLRRVLQPPVPAPATAAAQVETRR